MLDATKPAVLNILLFFFNAPATTEIYTLSLHDALPISFQDRLNKALDNLREAEHDQSPDAKTPAPASQRLRSEEHTSELQSHSDLVCRLLLEKKKQQQPQTS